MKQVYHALPEFAQNLACTWAGYRRFRERYTPHFHDTLASWNQNLTGSIEPLHEIQRQRLGEVIERARKFTRYYQNLAPMCEADDPHEAIRETLSKLPVLEKEQYRADTEAFLMRDLAPSEIRRGVTAGTTGTQLDLFSTPEALAEEYATVWRLRQSQGIGLSDDHMTWVGQDIVPFSQVSPPFWRRNSYGHQMLYSIYHMKPDNLDAYIDDVLSRKSVYVSGYPSALHLMARAMLDRGRTFPSGVLKGVFTSSESLLAFQKQTICEAFGTSIWERYGSSEFAVSMTSCREGHLHVDMEFCIVEVEPSEETEDYVRGHLLVTGLARPATPFLRYRIGDVGTRLKKPCACGRPGDVFLDIDGRIEDFVMTPDSRLVGRLDHIFKGLAGIEEAQILQDSKQAIEVLIVPGGDFGPDHESALIREVRARLGDEIEIIVRRVTSIPREANGKFRAVKSAVGRLQHASS
jgi:phenylacetate-CoA ligase